MRFGNYIEGSVWFGLCWKSLCDSQIVADQYVVGLLFNELHTIALQTRHILKQNSDTAFIHSFIL